MKVKCIDTMGATSLLTIGKIYDVLEDTGTGSQLQYNIVSDASETPMWFIASRFVEVGTGMKKIKCVNNTGFTSALTVGKLYDIVKEMGLKSSTNYMVRGDDGTESYWTESLFVVVSVVKVKCIDAKDAISTHGVLSYNLVPGIIYDAIIYDIQTEKGYELITSLSTTWRPYFRANRFVVVDDVPDTVRSMKAASSVVVDKEEERLRAIFTRPVADKFTCGKCSAPLPCRFHT
jgi:hypothetical protein